MINAEVLAAMRTDAHLINVGRGDLVDEPALIEALQTGEIGAVSLDVFVTEPLPPTARCGGWTTSRSRRISAVTSSDGGMC